LSCEPCNLEASDSFWLEQQNGSAGSLGSETARQGKAVRRVFTKGLQPFIELMTKLAPGRSKAAKRRTALAMITQMVGAVALARAVSDRELANEILSAVKSDLISTFC